MIVLKVFLILVEIISGSLLVGIILLQKTKDEGLGLAFGAAVGESLFGSRAGNVLTKITIWLAAIFLVTTLWIGMLLSSGNSSVSVVDRSPVRAPAAAPAAPLQPISSPATPSAGSMAVPAPSVEPMAVPATPVPSAAPANP